MIKVLKGYLPYILAVLPQLFFREYYLVLIMTTGVGFLAGYFINAKRVFLRMMIFELIVISVLFYTHRSRVEYLDPILENLGLSLVLVPIVFILFNALNIAILFFFGYKVQQLISSSHIQKV